MCRRFAGRRVKETKSREAGFHMEVTPLGTRLRHSSSWSWDDAPEYGHDKDTWLCNNGFKRSACRSCFPGNRISKHKDKDNAMDKYPNTQDGSAHHPRARASGARQSDGQSGQGEWGGQPSYMDVDNASPHYPGSGVVNSPAYYSQRNQGGVTSHLSQITEPRPHVPQLLNHRSPVPSTGTHRYNGPASGSLGSYTSNPAAGYIPTPTPALSATPLRQELPYSGAGAAGNNGSPSYYPADSTRPPTATSRTGGGASRGHDPQRYASSAVASSSGPTSSSMSNAHQSQSRPQCKLPRCEKAAIFDRSINEQREFCEDHIGHVIPVGFAGRCVTCGKMPARLDSEFCSDACRNMSAQMASSSGNTGPNRQQQQPTPTSRQTAPPMQRVVSSGGASGAAVGVPSRRPAEISVPEGLGPTCQECRRPITKEARFSSHFCSRNCEEANRKYNTSSKSRR